ncbi:MAG: amidohydrolase family protein, partial [Acidimicrobiia bacterium]
MEQVLRGGTVVDGSGRPAEVADVHLRDGSVVAVGTVDPPAGAEVLDVTGLVVSPGFIDLHTHFDAQVLWDPDLTPSGWHGVTTVVQGNCGFGLAPTRPEDRETIMETLKNVEGMNVETLRAGIRWDFESFPEYLALVASLPKRLNVGTFLGHTPLRTYVMGPVDAATRAATPEEVARMAGLLAEGLAAGAVGFSSSQAPSHMGAAGRPVPSRLADDDEVTALLGVVSRSRRPLVEITYGHLYDLEEVAALSRDLSVRITWGSLLTGLHGGPGASLELLERASA